MIIPIYPKKVQGAAGNPPWWWGNTVAPDGDADPWVSAPLGSQYRRVDTGNVTLYLKTTSGGTDSDWKAIVNPSYLLRDEFTTNSAAGAVNGTAADPGGDGTPTRVVTDTESKLSISGQKAIFSGGKATPAYGDPRLHYSSTIARVVGAQGKLVYFQVSLAQISGLIGEFGLDSDTVTNLYYSYLINSTSTLSVRDAGSIIAVSSPLTVGQSYEFVVAIATTGAKFYMRVNGQWRLLYVSTSGTGGTFYMALSNRSAVYASKTWRYPTLQYLNAPLANDGFGSTFGTTDGVAGATESSSYGSGGGSVTWTARVGTWANTAGKAAASALSGGLAVATVPTSTKDVFIRANITRSAGVVGGVARWTDANNHILWYHDGTNVKVDQVVAGSVTNKVSAAIAYAENGRLSICLSGDTVTAWFGTTGAATVPVAISTLTGTAHGLYTTDTGNTLDNFVVEAVGTSNEHATLNQLSFGTPRGLFCVGDSKTEQDEWVILLTHELNKADPSVWQEVLPRFGYGGWTAATMKATIDSTLSSVTGTADKITINLGANDVGTMPTEAAWKANMNSIIDSLRAKWPSATIYIARAWRRSYAAQCNTLATWISDIVTAYNSTYIKVGMDERIWMENGDDGAALTTDGIHYNTTTGQVAAAAAWKTAMGY